MVERKIIDIFKDEWSSKFPDSFGVSSSGIADLFEDQRITWAEEKGITNQDDCGGYSQSFIEGCWAYVEENY